MILDFILSQADARPMYQQVMERIKERTISGDWPEGTKLSSIREMAVALKVSVITIKRAYQELEKEGVILVQQGKGCFVAGKADDHKEKQLEELNNHIFQAVKLAAILNLSDDELGRRLKEAQGRKPKEK